VGWGAKTRKRGGLGDKNKKKRVVGWAKNKLTGEQRNSRKKKIIH
jgi:hypothetical protein